MANDLVPISSQTGKKDDPAIPIWDLPPTRSAPPSGASAAQTADRQAAEAQRRGDETWESVRRADAGENRQGRWDWGDRGTWLWILAMFIFGIAVALIGYVLPAGRHAGQPIIHVY